jgi:hypothetical protein
MESRIAAFIGLIDEALLVAEQRLVDESDPVIKDA